MNRGRVDDHRSQPARARQPSFAGIKKRVDQVLTKLSPLFEELYAQEGRPSIPSELLLRSRILIALYSPVLDRDVPARPDGLVRPADPSDPLVLRECWNKRIIVFSVRAA
jgi:hypothetical protein